MRRYANERDLLRALETRLNREAELTGLDHGRLRRRVVFDRAAARLSRSAASAWVLKGGAALEFRYLNQARMTRDIDFATRLADLDASLARESLLEALGDDVDADGFVFTVSPASILSPDAAGRPAWRFTAQAFLAGKPFMSMRLDVAARGEELAATEFLRLPGTLSFAGIPARRIEAVTRRQHFAEKLHALTRDYGDRLNTRVRDLVDLTLLINNGLAADCSLVHVVRHVFAVRATHPVPEDVPDPPPGWAALYPQTVEGLVAVPADLDSAMSLLRAHWVRALAAESSGER